MKNGWLRVGLVGLLLVIAQMPLAPIAFAARANAEGRSYTASLPSGHHVQGRPPTKAAPVPSAQQLAQAEVALRRANQPDSASGFGSPGSQSPPAQVARDRNPHLCRNLADQQPPRP
jgi:hypothetical protein